MRSIRTALAVICCAASGLFYRLLSNLFANEKRDYPDNRVADTKLTGGALCALLSAVCVLPSAAVVAGDRMGRVFDLFAWIPAA